MLFYHQSSCAGSATTELDSLIGDMKLRGIAGGSHSVSKGLHKKLKHHERLGKDALRRGLDNSPQPGVNQRGRIIITTSGAVPGAPSADPAPSARSSPEGNRQPSACRGTHCASGRIAIKRIPVTERAVNKWRLSKVVIWGNQVGGILEYALRAACRQNLRSLITSNKDMRNERLINNGAFPGGSNGPASRSPSA